MDHNNFMKRIGSINFILNHSGIFFGGQFYIFVAFRGVFMSENLVFGFSSIKNCNADTVQNHLYRQDQPNFAKKKFHVPRLKKHRWPKKFYCVQWAASKHH